MTKNKQMFELGLKENDKRVIIKSPTKIEQMYGCNGRATYMTNEECIHIIIKILNKIDDNKKLKRILNYVNNIFIGRGD